jgi:hypothetical protein
VFVDCDPDPDAAGAAQAVEVGDGPDSEHVSVLVCFGVRLYVTLNEKELVVTSAFSAGDGETNVSSGLFGLLAADASVATMATSSIDASTATADSCSEVLKSVPSLVAWA